MRIYIFFALLTISLNSFSQEKLPDIDKSPLDISYYPDGYPLLKIQGKTADPLVARIVYSRPQKNERKIFGGLIEYGKVWRLGANEATEIEFFRDVYIGGTRVKKGRYTLYAIPYEDKWTMIVNKETDTWGSFRYEMKKDILRVDLPVSKQAPPTEYFVMLFAKANEGMTLMVTWDDVKVNLPITFSNL